MAIKMTDKQGRIWNYSDAEGSWSHGPHTIGCGAKNVSKWMIWDGPHRGSLRVPYTYQGNSGLPLSYKESRYESYFA